MHWSREMSSILPLPPFGINVWHHFYWMSKSYRSNFMSALYFTIGYELPIRKSFLTDAFTVAEVNFELKRGDGYQVSTLTANWRKWSYIYIRPHSKRHLSSGPLISQASCVVRITAPKSACYNADAITFHNATITRYSATIEPRLRGTPPYYNEENPYMDSSCPYMGGFILASRATSPVSI